MQHKYQYIILKNKNQIFDSNIPDKLKTIGKKPILLYKDNIKESSI